MRVIPDPLPVGSGCGFARLYLWLLDDVASYPDSLPSFYGAIKKLGIHGAIKSWGVESGNEARTTNSESNLPVLIG